MLKPSQQQAFDLMMSGQNVFLSGEAGTGKSYVLRHFLEFVTKSKRCLICAPTGIAAINVGGSTIHRTFRAPVGPILKAPTSAPDVVQEADVIIIDEISMCRCDLFDFVAKSIVKAEEMNPMKPKKQLIVVGDFFQLPPVVTDADREALEIAEGFAFDSEMWSHFGFRTIVLSEQVRQSGDLEFVTKLNDVRRGDPSGLDWINKHAAPKTNKGIHLCPTNKAAAEINNQAMHKLEGGYRMYSAQETGEVAESDRATAKDLALKKGARVMMIVNELEDRFQNGSLGTIRDMFDDTLTIDLDNGTRVKIERYKWEITKYEIVTKSNGKKSLEQKVIGTFVQFPIKVAYAITVHKSQGQTYDAVNLHPRCFAPGQLYVALSRVKAIKGLHLVAPIKDEYLITSPKVLRFYDIAMVPEDRPREHGGKREGAGRKTKYGCETVTMRVPKNLKKDIEQYISSRMSVQD